MDPYIQQLQDIENFWLTVIFVGFLVLAALAVIITAAALNSGEAEHQRKLAAIRGKRGGLG